MNRSSCNLRTDLDRSEIDLILSDLSMNGAISYIDLARAKSEALVNNACKQKELNLVMLNGDDNENGFKTNRSN